MELSSAMGFRPPTEWAPGTFVAGGLSAVCRLVLGAAIGSSTVAALQCTTTPTNVEEPTAVTDTAERPDKTVNAVSLGATEPLWGVKECAAFLKKSRRWVFCGLRLRETEQGSIPHSRLGRNPRFIPEELRAWAAMGFPPVAVFREWKTADEKHKRRSGL